MTNALHVVEGGADIIVMTPMPVTTLAIVGSTTFAKTHNDQIPTAHAIIGFLLALLEPDVVISGGAIGIDTYAEKVAARFGWTRAKGRFRAYLPTHRRWEPHGFRERNERIADDCTHLARISHADSTTYGSGWTYERAAELGKHVWQIELPHSGEIEWPKW